MKKLFYICASVFALANFCSCSDTTDCICPIETEVVNKAALQRSVSDWDGDCSDISNEDLGNGEVLTGDCYEE